MGQFANTLFTGLLGWAQVVVSDLWRLITGSNVSAWLRWLLDNWLPLTLLLCVAGLVIDLLVYIIRWQPYRVWGGMLRRLWGRGTAEPDVQDMEDDAQFQRHWVYADGTTSVEDLRKSAKEAPPVEEHLELPIRPVRRSTMYGSGEKAYYQPVYPPKWQQTKDEEHSGGRE